MDERHDPIVEIRQDADLFAPDVDPWADLEQAESDLEDRDRRIAELEAEVERLRGALEAVRSLANQARTDTGDADPMGWIYERCDAALEQKGAGDG